jgi:hypothetical protein
MSVVEIQLSRFENCSAREIMVVLDVVVGGGEGEGGFLGLTSGKPSHVILGSGSDRAFSCWVSGISRNSRP